MGLQSPLADFFHILVESPIDFLKLLTLWIRHFITSHGYFDVVLKHCILDLEKMEGKSSKANIQMGDPSMQKSAFSEIIIYLQKSYFEYELKMLSAFF